MGNKMKNIFKRKVLKIGDSLAITIPSSIVQDLSLSEGGIVRVELDGEEEIVFCKCPVCNYDFEGTQDGEKFCPCCGYEEVVK